MCAAGAAESEEEASVPVSAQDAETDDGQPSTEGNQPATGGEGPAISPPEADKHDHQHPGAGQGGDDAPIDNNSNGTEGTTVDAAATGLKEADPAAGNENGLGTDKTTAPTKGPEADPAAGAGTGLRTDKGKPKDGADNHKQGSGASGSKQTSAKTKGGAASGSTRSKRGQK